MPLDKEYQEMWNVLTRGMRADEKSSFENIMRGAKLSGVGTKVFGDEMSGKLREKTARAEGELGVKLGFKQASEHGMEKRQAVSESGALKRLSVSEAGADKRLAVQLKAAEERMKWEWEQKKIMISKNAKAKRRAGYKSLAVSALGGGLMSLGTDANFLQGMGMGMPGMAGIIGQQVGNDMNMQNMQKLLAGFGNTNTFGNNKSSLQDDWANFSSDNNDTDFNPFSFNKEMGTGGKI